MMWNGRWGRPTVVCLRLPKRAPLSQNGAFQSLAEIQYKVVKRHLSIFFDELKFEYILFLLGLSKSVNSALTQSHLNASRKCYCTYFKQHLIVDKIKPSDHSHGSLEALAYSLSGYYSKLYFAHMPNKGMKYIIILERI